MDALDFKTAFMYPFNRAVGMLNILWALIPIFGWFALGGFGVRLMQEFSKGQFSDLPKFSFVEDMKLGFMMFIKSLPFLIAYVIVISMVTALSTSIGGIIELLVNLFILPILAINFVNKETWISYFEFDVVKAVFSNVGDYLVAVVKSIALFLVYLVMCIILVGIPALAFTPYIFLADFYGKNVR